MGDPYVVLGVEPDADDETIRRRYLELVRQFTPEHHAKKFSAIRAAYEKLKDLNTRVRYRLFEQGKRDGIDEIIEELNPHLPKKRYGLQALLNTQKVASR